MAIRILGATPHFSLVLFVSPIEMQLRNQMAEVFQARLSTDRIASSPHPAVIESGGVLLAAGLEMEAQSRRFDLATQPP